MADRIAGTSARWYVLHVYSGFEKKIVESLSEQSLKKGIEEHFVEMLVPTEEVMEIRRGQKVSAERKFFPGYILLKMHLTDEAWNMVKNTPRVTGFLGAHNKPSPISEAEAMRIVQQVQEGIDKPRHSISFDIGEQVQVVDGPFQSFNGVVEDVDLENDKLKVSVSIFGRATPVELDYGQVKKL